MQLLPRLSDVALAAQILGPRAVTSGVPSNDVTRVLHHHLLARTQRPDDTRLVWFFDGERCQWLAISSYAPAMWRVSVRQDGRFLLTGPHSICGGQFDVLGQARLKAQELDDERTGTTRPSEFYEDDSRPYLVSYDIQVVAKTAREAALYVERIMRDPESMRPILAVTPLDRSEKAAIGVTQTIDLSQ